MRIESVRRHVSLLKHRHFHCTSPGSRTAYTHRVASPRLHICRTETAEGLVDYVSLLPPDEGLIGEAIVGALRVPPDDGEPRIAPEGFSRNAGFVELLQAVIRREAPRLAAYREEARSIGNGPVYVIDRRGRDDDPIRPAEVFGAFEARAGLITAESYEANPTHMILTGRGFFQLEDELLGILMREIRALADARRG